MGYRAIYALFLLVRPSSSDVFVPGQVWYSTTIQTSFLDPPLANTPGSRMKCASLANLSPDCHLFCLSGDFCSLYRAQVAAFHQPPPGYETSSCWTRNFDWPACPAPYQRLPGLEDLGCLREDNSPKSWSDARASCVALGGDLAVMRTSQDFFRLRSYYAAQSAVTGLWVGVYSEMWLNGRTPEPGEWFDGEPNGSGPCVDMRLSSFIGTLYNFYLSDNICSNVHGFLCQLL